MTSGAERVRTLAVAGLAGAIAGALILGVAGRAAMGAAATLRGMDFGYALGATLDVVMVSLIYGLAGGLLLGLLGRVRAGRWLAGAAMGALLFCFAFFTSEAARSAVSGMGFGFLRSTFGVSALLFLLWGLGTALLIRLFLPVRA